MQTHGPMLPNCIFPGYLRFQNFQVLPSHILYPLVPSPSSPVPMPLNIASKKQRGHSCRNTYVMLNLRAWGVINSRHQDYLTAIVTGGHQSP